MIWRNCERDRQRGAVTAALRPSSFCALQAGALAVFCDVGTGHLLAPQKIEGGWPVGAEAVTRPTSTVGTLPPAGRRTGVDTRGVTAYGASTTC